jgi:hypothetical protein
MARKQYLWAKLLEVLDRLQDQRLVEGAHEMVAAYDGMQRDRTPC